MKNLIRIVQVPQVALVFLVLSVLTVHGGTKLVPRTAYSGGSLRQTAGFLRTLDGSS